jgi:hypothetical protein
MSIWLSDIRAQNERTEFWWPVIGFVAAFVVPLVPLTASVAWMKTQSPPLLSYPRGFTFPLALGATWLGGLIGLSVATSLLGVAGGSGTRCVRAMPLILGAMFLLVRSIAHRRRAPR